MNCIAGIITMLLLLSCTSDQTNKDNDVGKSEVKEIEILNEVFKVNKTDSIRLIQSWKYFIKNMNNIKSESFDTVVCWSSEEFQMGNYSAPKTLLFDSCLARYLLPLKKTKFWPMFNKDDFNMEIHKGESESTGRYCISFPRDKDEQPMYHVSRHYFYFKKTGEKFLFQGYVYN